MRHSETARDADESSNHIDNNSKSHLNQKSSAKEIDHKAACAVESDHDDASSTSSCSCEDHSSVAGHSEEDPHGDLDYEEDSITNSPANDNERSVMSCDVSEYATTPLKNTDQQQNLPRNLDSQASGSSSGQAEKIDANQEQLDEKSDPSQNGHKKDASPLRNTRIRSFINFDYGGDEESRGETGAGSAELVKLPPKDRSHKSYEGLLKYFFKDACYFQIKSINHENVEISKSMGVWSTPVQNEVRLNVAFREHRNVILIFSVQQSGGFQGFARMVSEAGPTNKPVPWVLPERLSKTALGGIFKVEWLCTKELPFQETRDLTNPFNNNKPVKVARDGQQVEPKVGKKLCLLFPRGSKKRLLSSIDTLKRQTHQRKQLLQKRDNYYPLNDARVYNSVVRDRHNPYILPHPVAMNGFDGGVASPPTSQLVHDCNQMYSYPHNLSGFRGPTGGRRRGLDQFGPSFYQRHSFYPNHPMSSFRRNNQHLPPLRNFEGQPPGGHHPPPHNELEASPFGGPNHHYPHHSPQFNGWPPNMDINRFHPYQRYRR